MQGEGALPTAMQGEGALPTATQGEGTLPTTTLRHIFARMSGMLDLSSVENQLEAFLVADLVCVVAHLVCDLPPVGRFDSG